MVTQPSPRGELVSHRRVNRGGAGTIHMLTIHCISCGPPTSLSDPGSQAPDPGRGVESIPLVESQRSRVRPTRHAERGGPGNRPGEERVVVVGKEPQQGTGYTCFQNVPSWE